MKRSVLRLLIVFACFFLGIANISFWAVRDLLDSERFGRQVAAAVKSDSSAQALATRIVDEAMAGSALICTTRGSRSPLGEQIVGESTSST